MDGKILFTILFLVLIPVFIALTQANVQARIRDLRAYNQDVLKRSSSTVEERQSYTSRMAPFHSQQWNCSRRHGNLNENTSSAWVRDERRESHAVDNRVSRRTVHYHTKRHMLPEQEAKRRVTTPRIRELRKKPSGHLTPLAEDDIDNDEVVSVAIGPPPIRPKYDKVHWKHPPKAATQNISNATATNILKDVFIELGREFLSRQVSEDFIFGQFIGNAMKNMTAETKLKMQHEVLELILKYQKINRGEVTKPEEKNTSTNTIPMLKDLKFENKKTGNDTEDAWPDFSNLAKIVG